MCSKGFVEQHTESTFFIWHQFVPFGREAIFKFKCILQLVFLSTMGALVPRVMSL